jgi:hypothetical protein
MSVRLVYSSAPGPYKPPSPEDRGRAPQKVISGHEAAQFELLQHWMILKESLPLRSVTRTTVRSFLIKQWHAR